MPKYARIVDGVVTEIVELESGSVSQFKLASDGGPVLRPYEEAPAADYVVGLETRACVDVIEIDRVVQTWPVTRLPIEAQRAAVKVECGRRIYTPFPQWKQANMTARAVELQEIRSEDGALSGALADELADLRAAWDWIKSVRLASDAIEALDPIPLNYTDDVHWPAQIS